MIDVARRLCLVPLSILEMVPLGSVTAGRDLVFELFGHAPITHAQDVLDRLSFDSVDVGMLGQIGPSVRLGGGIVSISQETLNVRDARHNWSPPHDRLNNKIYCLNTHEEKQKTAYNGGVRKHEKFYRIRW